MVERNLCMNKRTFDILCSELQPYIKEEDTVFRESVSVEQRVRSCHTLETNVEYLTISNLFGLGLSTVCAKVIETCKAIAKNLVEKYVYIPRVTC